jgi:hypothetical protein
MRLRKLTKMQTVNNGTRSLFESVMMPEIILALRDWGRSTSVGVLIGALGLSFHCKPRFTQDIDFLVQEFPDIPDKIRGFTRTAPHSLQHDLTQVEVNILSPSSGCVPKEIAEQVFLRAILSNGIRVASASGLVALKLFGLRRVQDQADAVALIKTGGVDLSGWPISPEKLAEFEGLVAVAKTNPG